jgi:GT2 family glycosyltransferase
MAAAGARTMPAVERLRPPVRVAAIILNWNQAELTERAAASVAPQVAHVYIADNGSQAGDVDRLASFAQQQDMTLIRNGVNRGYAAGNNPAIRQAIRAGYDGILIMNNDAVAEPGAVETMVERLRARPQVAAAAPMITDPTGEVVQHVHCTLDLKTGRWDRVGGGTRREEVDPQPRSAGYLSGEALLARAEVFEQVGGFDERYEMYFEDADWSARVRRAGWELEALPAAVVRHDAGASSMPLSKTYLFARGRVLFMRWALGASRTVAFARTAPMAAREMVSLARRGRLWHAVRGELAGELAGLIRQDRGDPAPAGRDRPA